MTTYYLTTNPEIFGEDLIICTNGKQYRIVPTLSNGRDCYTGADLYAVREYVIAKKHGDDTDAANEAEYKKLTASSEDLFNWDDVMTDIARDCPDEIHDLDFDPAELENAVVLRVID